MKKEFMFIASLPTKTHYFDGERNKSKDVLNALRKEYGDKFSTINLSKNQYLQVLKMIILSFFIKYRFVFVSKCLVGGSRAIKLLLKFSKKINKERIIFYVIGNGSNGFEDKTIYFDCLKKTACIIVESPDVKKEFVDKKIMAGDKMVIVPCVKPVYSLKPIEKEYPIETLNVIFFSRVVESKGLMDAILAITELNESSNKILFNLDIAGGIGATKEEQEFLDKVKKISNDKEYINYLGLSLRIDGEESYRRLQHYDLHIFPSKFFQECAPGSIIDMFIAGVPTLSSNFSSAHYLMSEKDSYFFKMCDIKDLKEKLLFIYNNQMTLNSKRIAANKNYPMYTTTSFINKLNEVLSSEAFKNGK